MNIGHRYSISIHSRNIGLRHGAWADGRAFTGIHTCILPRKVRSTSTVSWTPDWVTVSVVSTITWNTSPTLDCVRVMQEALRMMCTCIPWPNSNTTVCGLKQVFGTVQYKIFKPECDWPLFISKIFYLIFKKSKLKIRISTRKIFYTGKPVWGPGFKMKVSC